MMPSDPAEPSPLPLARPSRRGEFVVTAAVAVVALLVGLGIGLATRSGHRTAPAAVPAPVVTVIGPTVTADPVAAPGPGPVTIPGTGTFVVGEDIRPGTYRAAARPGCYWERDRDTTGTRASIITNADVDGPVVVTIAPSDAAFTTARCADFHTS